MYTSNKNFMYVYELINKPIFVLVKVVLIKNLRFLFHCVYLVIKSYTCVLFTD